MFTHAITRLPGENFADGLTTSNLGRPDYSLVLQQHTAYRRTLLNLGLDLIVLPAEPAYPDAYFVEDPAIITPKIAVITQPGAPTRRGEEITLEPVIKYYRPVFHILPPGTLDGGDILQVEDHFFIGLSERTNSEGANQLMAFLTQAGHTSETILVPAGLHLKSSVNYLGNDTLLLTKTFADFPGFTRFTRLLLDADEEYAANTLCVNNTLLMPKGFPKTRSMLSQLGMRIIEMDVSEMRKMDGGLTCLSLRF